jgi:type IV fimbrial biogenesis protein FimT
VPRYDRGAREKKLHFCRSSGYLRRWSEKPASANQPGQDCPMKTRTGAFWLPDAVGDFAGFSLVELMVTVFLAAILMAIGVPIFRDSVANNRLTAQTNDLIAAMTLARSQAITLNQPVTFCRTTSDESVENPICAGASGSWEFWIVRADTSGTIVRRGTLLGSSLVMTSSLANDRVQFASDGLARTNNDLLPNDNVADITICSTHGTTDNKRQIMLGTGNRVSTAKDSGACP